MPTSPLHGLHEGRPRGAAAGRGVVQRCKFKDQLGLELLSLSKTRDGYATRLTRPRGAAVFDF